MGDGFVQRDQGGAAIIGWPPFAVGDDGAGRRRCGIGDAAVAVERPFGIGRNLRDARAASVMAPTTDALSDFVGRIMCGMPLFGEVS